MVKTMVSCRFSQQNQSSESWCCCFFALLGPGTSLGIACNKVAGPEAEDGPTGASQIQGPEPREKPRGRRMDGGLPENMG